MNESLDPAIIEAYALAPSSVEIVETLELRSEALEEPMYLVSGRLNRVMKVDGEDKTFKAVSFTLDMPTTDEDGLQELSVTISNIGNKVVEFCEVALRARAEVEIRYSPYRLDDITKPMLDPRLRLFLEDVSADGLELTGRANPMNFANLQFPNQIYTRARFPGLGD